MSRKNAKNSEAFGFWQSVFISCQLLIGGGSFALIECEVARFGNLASDRLVIRDACLSG